MAETHLDIVALVVHDAQTQLTTVVVEVAGIDGGDRGAWRVGR